MTKLYPETTCSIPSVIASGASFDRSRRYRYSLSRQFDSGAGILTIIMLNPSKADAQHDDPTITRCIRFAYTNGFQQLTVVNLFAFRATAPLDLKKASNPVGRENNSFIEQAVAASALTLAAWGNHGQFRSRDIEILELLKDSTLHCLGTNKGGSPKHPLYVAGNQKLQIYR